MLTYIGDDSYLQLHMNLLRDESKTIQVEAFHVFKIFVANPSRPPRVQAILFKNKERLVNLLKELTPHRSDDKQFLEDMKTVLAKLEDRQQCLPRFFPRGCKGDMNWRSKM
eukprot:g22636.t1